MKKSKLLVLGLIALMLVGGLVLASCDAACPGSGSSGGPHNCKAKKDSIKYKDCTAECIRIQMGSRGSGSYSCTCG